jgi:meso-butanediol dehydrogenase / (S,S)-butanediol dehydrogenase / diacetyl reductase
MVRGGTLQLAGRVAVVTGGCGGIGRAVVRQFVEEGASVVVADLADAFPSDGWENFDESRVALETIDVSRDNNAARVVDRAVSEFGHLDILVNAVSAGHVATLLEATEEEFDETVRVLLKSYWLAARAAMPHLVKSGHGAIVNFSSMQAGHALPGRAAIQASMGAISAMTRQLALEFGPAGVRVNAVSPGIVLHEKGWAMYRDPSDSGRFSTDDDLELRRQCYPLRRFGTPQDIAPVVAFLVSDDSAWITGVDLLVDGGASIQLAEALVFPPFRRLWRSAIPDQWDAGWSVDLP